MIQIPLMILKGMNYRMGTKQEGSNNGRIMLYTFFFVVKVLGLSHKAIKHVISKKKKKKRKPEKFTNHCVNKIFVIKVVTISLGGERKSKYGIT